MALRNCILTLLAVGCLRHPRDCGTRPYRADRHATRAEHFNNIGASTGREGTLADLQPAGFMLEGARQSCLAEVKHANHIQYCIRTGFAFRRMLSLTRSGLCSPLRGVFKPSSCSQLRH